MVCTHNWLRSDGGAAASTNWIRHGVRSFLGKDGHFKPRSHAWKMSFTSSSQRFLWSTKASSGLQTSRRTEKLAKWNARLSLNPVSMSHSTFSYAYIYICIVSTQISQCVNWRCPILADVVTFWWSTQPPKKIKQGLAMQIYPDLSKVAMTGSDVSRRDLCCSSCTTLGLHPSCCPSNLDVNNDNSDHSWPLLIDGCTML